MISDASVEPRPRKRLRHAARREQLLDVAESLFVRDGYSAVTMEDIARVAGVSRPIVYNHFTSREGVYVACVRRARDQYHAEIQAVFDPELDARSLLATGADVFFAMLERDPGRWKLLFGSNAVLPGEYADQLAELRFATIDLIADMLRHRAPPHTDRRRVDAAANALSGVGERLGHWWLKCPMLTRAELVEYYTDMVWSGLRPYVETDRPAAQA
ncbi:TetR/AcrR family transcriptional regulator [Nocardia xishanensis]|uniref:TetR/AcrR family transcriptional regulator n=1 Tax=Nocardia xishanensis TaxID=238964 RepID=UPI00340C8F3D